ncbi:MAG: hypothetical protein ACI4XF_03150, partial [Oscillospiraceae bacterium]
MPILCSCSQQKISEGFYAFDTYGSITLYGSRNELSQLRGLLEDISGELQTAYEADANTLDGEYITECAALSSGLSEQLGGGLDITCGALTGLWGISTDSPVVPSREDIGRALDTLCGSFDSLSELPDGTRLDL